MALKTTQTELKRRFKKQIKDLKYAIYAECFACTGFQTNGYADCEMDDCPLYQHRLKHFWNRGDKSLASFLRVSRAKIQQK